MQRERHETEILKMLQPGRVYKNNIIRESGNINFDWNENSKM